MSRQKVCCFVNSKNIPAREIQRIQAVACSLGVFRLGALLRFVDLSKSRLSVIFEGLLISGEVTARKVCVITEPPMPPSVTWVPATT